jgi:hypothetical protein
VQLPNGVTPLRATLQQLTGRIVDELDRGPWIVDRDGILDCDCDLEPQPS